jgi:hypothetical protein
MTISVRESGMPQTVSMNSAFDENPALDFKSETNEERRNGIEVGDGDADVIERSEFPHQTPLSLTGATSLRR